MALKKVQIAKVYRPDGTITMYHPENNKKFDYKELQSFVGGYLELVVPLDKHTTVYVNEEGKMKALPPNRFTWDVLDWKVYQLNGYSQMFRVAGPIVQVLTVPV